jgi:hypothetical protein
MLLVVFVGLLIGGLFAHFFGNKSPAMAPIPTAFPSVTPLPTEKPSPFASLKPTPFHTATPKPGTSPSGSPSASPGASTSPSASPSPSSSPKATSSPHHGAEIIVTPPPVAKPTSEPAKAAVPEKTETPKPAAPAANPTAVNGMSASGPAGASAVVSSYVHALMQGNRTTAASYLSQGQPNESFIGAKTQVNSISSAVPNANGTYRVTADVTGDDGQEYFITFTVQSGPFGMQITDHYSIKPH